MKRLDQLFASARHAAPPLDRMQAEHIISNAPATSLKGKQLGTKTLYITLGIVILAIIFLVLRHPFSATTDKSTVHIPAKNETGNSTGTKHLPPPTAPESPAPPPVNTPENSTLTAPAPFLTVPGHTTAKKDTVADRPGKAITPVTVGEWTTGVPVPVSLPGPIIIKKGSADPRISPADTPLIVPDPPLAIPVPPVPATDTPMVPDPPAETLIPAPPVPSPDDTLLTVPGYRDAQKDTAWKNTIQPAKTYKKNFIRTDLLGYVYNVFPQQLFFRTRLNTRPISGAKFNLAYERVVHNNFTIGTSINYGFAPSSTSHGITTLTGTHSSDSFEYYLNFKVFIFNISGRAYINRKQKASGLFGEAYFTYAAVQDREFLIELEPSSNLRYYTLSTTRYNLYAGGMAAGYKYMFNRLYAEALLGFVIQPHVSPLPGRDLFHESILKRIEISAGYSF